LVWQHFDAIRMIPRPSKHEEAVAAHVQQWAASKGFGVQRDAAGNVVVKVPACAGREAAPVVILQGHLDMVPEKNQDVVFDFEKDPIQVRVVDGWVYATGTTLGADNGIGLALAMAAAEDPACEHGPLELLFTVDEETGLTGAEQLDPSLLTGKTLLNLDTEEDGALYIGCAGGATAYARFELNLRPAAVGTLAYHLKLRGLRGGHSGVDIHENRANAIKLAARLLAAARSANVAFELVSFVSGSKHNAIPREADVLLRVPLGAEEVMQGVIAQSASLLALEFADIEPAMTVELVRYPDDEDMALVWSHADRCRVIDALLGCPHGVLAMSRAVPGLVETSHNLAVIETDPGLVRLTTSARSSVAPALTGVLQQVQAVLSRAGAKVEVGGAYPGWRPNPASPILAVMGEAYEALFSVKAKIKAIHAGLECGLIGEKFPGMDMVSMGPQIESPHSPDERVGIDSVGRAYQLLLATLARLR
jgi:dipeptidase D